MNKVFSKVDSVLLDQCGDTIIGLDLQYKVVEFNRVAEVTFGIPRNEIYGKNLFDFLNQQGFKLSFSHLELKRSINIEPVFVDGTIHFPNQIPQSMRWKYIFCGNKYHDQLYFLIIGKEGNSNFISSVKETNFGANQSQEFKFLKNIIKNLPEFVYWKDINLIYLGCNQNVAEYLGLESVADVIGKSDWDFNFSEEKIKEISQVDLSVVEKGEKVVVHDYILRPDGSTNVLLTSKTPMYDDNGEIIGLLGVSVDITKQTEIEGKLKEANQQAEVNQAKTLFLANMSHDFKTPITGIISTAEYLVHSLDNPEHQTRADNIVQSSLRLLELINEIIELSRLRFCETPNNKNRFELKQLINDVVKLLKPSINDKNLNFHLTYDKKIPGFLMGNRWYIYRILLNLLSNAVKFTNKGHIKLDICLAKEENRAVVVKVTIEDTGIGIPKDKQDYIFEQFSRLTPSYEGIYSGSGVGLYIVKQFLEAIEGEIYLESDEGKGSIFTCIFPLQKSILDAPLNVPATKKKKDTHISQSMVSLKSNSKTYSQKPALPQNKKFNILIVEDNFIVAQALIDTLSSFNQSADLATSSKEALSLFLPGKYHLIFMDLGLPDGDGKHLTKIFRQLENNSNVKSYIVAISAHVDRQSKADCFQYGMDDVYSKPLLYDHAHKILEHIEMIHSEASIGHETALKTNPSFRHENLVSIDLEAGAKLINSDIEAAKEMLKLLIETLPTTKVQLNEAYYKNDVELLIKVIHKLHGGLCYCGTPRLKKIAYDFETDLKEGRLEHFEYHFYAISHEIDEVMTVFEGV